MSSSFKRLRKKKGKGGWVALKIDLEKAYDRIQWAFLRSVLESFHFPENWIKLVLFCLSSASMSLLWNGGITPSFKPLRGLRQGDPLSPYLFVLCLEKLSHMISALVQNRKWRLCKFARGAPVLSHLFFADDLV